MTTTSYLWDTVSDNLIHKETNGNNRTVYTQEPSRYGRLHSQRRTETQSQAMSDWYCYDSKGDTRELTNSDSFVSGESLYDAWGNVLAANGFTATPFLWGGGVGYQADEDTGNVYIRARSYRPPIGRWVSPDPLLFVDGPNVYAAYFIPAAVDPTGTSKIQLTFNAFIHKNLGQWFWEPDPVPWDPTRVSSQYQFKGDNRRFGESGSSRMTSTGSIDSCSIGSAKAFGTNAMGASHRRELLPCPYETPGCSGYFGNHKVETGKLLVNRVNSYFGSCYTVLEFNASGAYPFVPVPQALTPKIDYLATFVIKALAYDRVEVCIGGSHDSFPAYEGLVNGKVAYEYDAKGEGNQLGPNLWNLGNRYFQRRYTMKCVKISAPTPKCCGGTCE